MSKSINIHTHIGAGGVTAKSVNDELNSIEGEFGVDISCLGGSVIEGIQMFNSIDTRSKKDNVTAHIGGIAASMGHMMSLSGSALPTIVDYGIVLVHKPRIAEDTVGSTPFEINMLETMYSSALTAISGKSGVSVSRLNELMSANDGEGTWLTAKELHAEGLCQEPNETTISDKAGMTAQLKDAFMAASIIKTPLNKSMSKESEMVSMDAFKAVELKLTDATQEIETLKTGNEALQGKNAELLASIQGMEKAKIEDFVDVAFKAGRLKEDQVEKFVELGLTNEDLMKSIVDSLPVFKAAPSAPNLDKGKGDLPSMTYDEMRKNDPVKLQEIAKDSPEMFAKMLDTHTKSLTK